MTRRRPDRIRALVLAALLVLLACARPVAPRHEPWTRAEYFQPAELHPDPSRAGPLQEWYAAVLGAMDEPSFRALAVRPGRCYRFLWLRTWHPPMAARVCEVAGSAVGELRVLDGRSRPGAVHRLVELRRTSLSPAAWNLLQARVRAAGLWEGVAPDPRDPGLAEGSRWVFEGLDDGRRRVVDLYSPDDRAWQDLGLSMMRLCGAEIPDREVY